MVAMTLNAFLLVAVTVAIHATGLAVLLRALMRLRDLPPRSVWHIAGMLIAIVWWLLLLHLVEISVWALFYWWQGCMPDAETAFYFSGATYTTIGYGDVVLEKPWRMLGPIEGLTGILMCALSTGYFFVVVNRIHQSGLEKTMVRQPEQ